MEPFLISGFVFIYFISYSCMTYKLNQDACNLNKRNRINKKNENNYLIIYFKYKIKNLGQFKNSKNNKKNKIYPFN